MNTYDGPMAEQFEHLLLQRHDELRLALAALSPSGAEGSVQEVTDFKELASRSTDADFDALQAERLAHEWQGVESARQRLAAGTFGRCLHCGQAIDLQRLLALPEAELCLPCRQAQEAVRH